MRGCGGVRVLVTVRVGARSVRLSSSQIRPSIFAVRAVNQGMKVAGLVGSTDFRSSHPQGHVPGRGAARAEDAQGTPTQSDISPSILIYEDYPSTHQVPPSPRKCTFFLCTL